jgi:hypothetical protein
VSRVYEVCFWHIVNLSSFLSSFYFFSCICSCWCLFLLFFVCILFLHVVVTCHLALHFKGASYGFSFFFFLHVLTSMLGSLLLASTLLVAALTHCKVFKKKISSIMVNSLFHPWWWHKRLALCFHCIMHLSWLLSLFFCSIIFFMCRQWWSFFLMYR